MGKLLVVVFLIVGTMNVVGQSYPPTFRDLKLASPSEFPLFATQVAADSKGNTFWAGGFQAPVQSVGSLSLTNLHPEGPDGFDAFVFKMGLNLDERWARSGGGPGAQGITGLAVDANRDCYFLVHSSTNAFVFDTRLYNSPSNHFSVVFKYSSGGEYIWSHQINGVTPDYWAKPLCLDSQTNIFFGGTFSDSRSAVRKLSPVGETIWSRASTTPVRAAQSFALQTDLAGNCYLLTSINSFTNIFGGLTVTNSGWQNYILVKYDAGGNELWAKTGGSATYGIDYGVDLAIDTNGHAYVWSAIQSTNALFGDIQVNHPGASWFLTKYNNMGEALWATRVPSVALTAVGGISIDQNNNVLMNASARYGLAITNALLASCTSNGQILWTKQTDFSGPNHFMDEMLWTSRLIDVPEVGLMVAGQVNKESGAVVFDDFVFPAPFTRTLFAKLTFDPHLSSSRDGDKLILSWPTNEVGFVLQSSENMTATNGWISVDHPVAVLEGQHVVTNAISGTNRFYRLSKPLP